VKAFSKREGPWNARLRSTGEGEGESARKDGVSGDLGKQSNTHQTETFIKE